MGGLWCRGASPYNPTNEKTLYSGGQEGRGWGKELLPAHVLAEGLAFRIGANQCAAVVTPLIVLLETRLPLPTRARALS